MMKNLKKIHILWFFIAFLFTFLLIPPFFEMFVFPEGDIDRSFKTLDISWAVAHNYANFKDLVWGTDFAFTHGPLSPYAIKVGWGNSKLGMLLFDIFYLTNFFLIVFLSLKENKNKGLTLVFIVLSLLTIPQYIGGGQSVLLFLMLFYWLNYSLKNPRAYYSYIFQTILMILLFYIKFNTGLISFALFYFVLSYQIFYKKIPLKYSISIAILPIIIVLVSSNLLNVQLIPYIQTAFELISGYNETMQMACATYDSWFLKSVIFILISVLLFAFTELYKQSFEKQIKSLLFISIFGLILFITYKQAFVRGDEGHIMGFFQYLSFLLLACIPLFDENRIKIKTIFAFVLAVFIGYINIEVIERNYKEITFNKTNYIEGFKNFNETFASTLLNNQTPLPQHIRSAIGNQTVDVYPWDIMLLLENQLNYSPRPVIQSYSAYTKDLEDLNFEKYNNPKTAPEFVLYDLLSIDNRYPFFDETKLNIALLKNYHLHEAFTYGNNEMLLFKKNDTFRPITFQKTKEYAILSGSAIVPEKDIFYEIDIYNSFTGTIKKTLLQAPTIHLHIKTKNMQMPSYKTSKSLLKLGLYGQYYFETETTFKEYVQNKINPTNEILGIYIKPDLQKYFNDKIKITEYKITQ